MKKYLPLFCVVSSSLFGEGALEEKPFTVASRAINFSRRAEKEFEKMDDRSTKKGIKLLEEASLEPSFKRLNVETQISIFLQLADGYHRQKEYGKEEELLQKMVQNSLFEPYYVKLEARRGRFYVESSQPEKAEAVLKALSKIHPKTLSKSDRDDIAALWAHLEREYRLHLMMGEKRLREKKYTAAAVHYELLLHASDRRVFPKNESQIVRRDIRRKLLFRLSECYVHEGRYEDALALLEELQHIPETGATKELTSEGLFLLAYTQNAIQDFAAAEKTILAQLQMNSSEEGALLLYAIALETANEEARFQAEALLTTPLLKAKRELLVAHSLEKKKKREAAGELLRSLLHSPVQKEALFQMGQLHMRALQFDEAVIRLEEALSLKGGEFREELYSALVFCYIELAKRQNTRASAYVERAESCLKELQKESQEYSAHEPLALRLCLFQALILQDENAAEQLYKYAEQKQLEKVLLALSDKTLFLQTASKNSFSDLHDRLRIQELATTDKAAAVECCQEFLQSCPQSLFRSEVFKQLAALQLSMNEMDKAAQTVERCLTEYPDIKERDLLLFLLAEAKTSTQFEQAKLHRKELLRDYPASPYAAQSFLLLFSEEEYQNGAPLAMKHLEEFLVRYPEQSERLVPLQIFAHVALKEKSHLLEAFHLYSKWQEKLLPPFKAFARHLAESALLQEGSAHALEMLDSSIEEEHPLFYEVKVRLARQYAATGQFLAARNQLAHLLPSDQKKSDAHLLLGQMEMSQAHFPEAIDYFDLAENGAVGEKLLEARLSKSECLQKMNRLDEAILLLSQVINDSTASQLRIKAMLRRAEIYESQKRYELAIKQLEAVARIPGEWGQKAKERLEKYYNEA